ncbi:hypothetical protein OAF49_01400 [Akkermansiaceae bacterium]|nr:hypothetical protein [Akkermansiaceae bacterium]
MSEENKYSQELIEKLKTLVTSGQLTGLWLGEESMGYDIQLAFSNSDTKTVTSLDRVEEKKLEQLFHDWAWDNGGDVGWGFYHLLIGEDSKIKIVCSGEREDESGTPFSEWTDEILSSTLLRRTNGGEDNYTINLSIEHREKKGFDGNYANFHLSIEDNQNDSIIEISKETKTQIYINLVKIFYKENVGVNGFSYETDDLSVRIGMSKVIFNDNEEYDLF